MIRLFVVAFITMFTGFVLGWRCKKSLIDKE